MFKKLMLGLVMIGLLLGSISIESSGVGGRIIISRARSENNNTLIVFYQYLPDEDVEIDPREICLCYTNFSQYDQGKSLEELFLKCSRGIRKKIENGWEYMWIEVWKEEETRYIWFEYIWI